MHMSSQGPELFVTQTPIFLTLFKWNLLDKEIQNCTSIAKFKKELLSIIRPVKNSTFRVFDITGIKLLTRLRLHFSALNEHRFRHEFDCITLVCICGLANEDNEHFFLHCPQYHGLRLDLFDQISDIPGIDLT